ncbi:Hsp20/alpha crystallin family protein, partial [Mycobacterium avium]
DNLDTDKIEASYRDGVLSLHIPVAEKAKPRKIAVGRGEAPRAVTETAREVVNA